MNTSTRNLSLSALLLLAALAVRSSAQTAAPAAPAAAGQAGAPAAGTAAAPVVAAPAAPAGPQVVIGGNDANAGVATRGRDSAGRDTLSVDFPEEDIRGILRNVADLFELNIIIPESLQGKTSIKLRDVTWRQIFKSVLDPVGHTFIEDGNIIKIVSNDTLLQEPVSTEMVILNYAKASDILPSISGLVGTTGGAKIVVDARSNALVITDTPSRLTKLKPLIEQLDHATAQVTIETKFIEVTESDVRDLGVNWSTLKNYGVSAAPSGSMNRTRDQIFGAAANGSNGRTGGTTNTTNATQDTSANNAGSVATADGTATSTSNTGTTAALSNAVSAGVTATTTTALDFLSTLANNGSTARNFSAVFSADQFGIVLSALNVLSSTKVISNPVITTLNNQEASINVGREDPLPKYSYNDQRGSFEVSGFEYKPIGIILKVTPQVNASGFIKLQVNPEVSQRNGAVNFGGAGGAEIPIIATRKVTTQVSLKDGYTMGIGGLLTSESTSTTTKVPLLGNIPLIGNLFKSKGKNGTTTNLLIFITARTVNADGAPIEQIFDTRQTRGLGLLPSDLPGYRDGGSPYATPPAVPAKK
jgi:type IV pilus secretin PilQ/predicted competence protein